MGWRGTSVTSTPSTKNLREETSYVSHFPLMIRRSNSPPPFLPSKIPCPKAGHAPTLNKITGLRAVPFFGYSDLSNLLISGRRYPEAFLGGLGGIRARLFLDQDLVSTWRNGGTRDAGALCPVRLGSKKELRQLH